MLHTNYEARFWFQFAESQGKTLAEVLGFSKIDYVSENEADFWLARWTRVNFLTQEVNRSGNNPKNHLMKNYLEDDDAVAEAMRKGQEAADKMKQGLDDEIN